jgi:glycosyltransferase involved in cell wall biosynthesis
MHPTITIITVCLNSQDTIGKTIDSVISQKYDALEYVIVDGGSTDNTLKIIEGYRDSLAGVLKLVSEPDNGIYDAMNKGIAMATGDLICMLNSDDRLTDGALNTVADAYDGDKYTVIYGMQRRIKDGRVYSCGFYGHEFLDCVNIPHQAAYVSRAAYERFGTYDTRYKCNSDHDLMIRLYNSGEVTFHPVEKVLADFLEGGMSSGYIGHIEDAKIRKKYGFIGNGQYIYLVFRAWFLRLIGRI